MSYLFYINLTSGQYGTIGTVELVLALGRVVPVRVLCRIEPVWALGRLDPVHGH